MTTAIFDFNTDRCQKRVADMRQLMVRKPRTSPEMEKLLNVSKSTICHFLRHLQARDLAHISSWRKGKTSFAPVWAWGAGEAAPKPAWGPYEVKVRKAPPPPPEPPAPLRTYTFKPQPVHRHPFDVMLYGEAA